MKKRILTMLMAVCILLPCISCTVEQAPIAGAAAYYLLEQEDRTTGVSLLEQEERSDLTGLSLESYVQKYLAGPMDASLRNPFPRELRLLKIEYHQVEKELQLVLSEEYTELSPLAKTLANACLVWTLTELEDVERVRLLSNSGADLMDGESWLTRDMYLIEPNMTEQEVTYNVYFTDHQSRYLIAEVRHVIPSESDSLGTHILYQLLDGPHADSDLQTTIPRGTRLLGFAVSNGLATVDLSEEFLINKPQTELAERMTVYSIVNSLTELDSIDRVRIYVEGMPQTFYRYLRLDEPLVRDETAIGPVRTGINELDATLYYQSWSLEYLAAVPTRIERDDPRPLGELVVRKLLSSEPVNGLTNLMPAGTKLLSLETIERVCYVDFSKEFANISGGTSAEWQTVRAVVASLCSIPGIDAVVLTIEGGTVRLPNVDLSNPISPDSNWFFPS